MPSFAVTVNVEVPVAVGVPANVAVPALKVIPGGGVPVRLNVNVDVEPPDAENVTVYGRFTVAPARVDGDTVIETILRLAEVLRVAEPGVNVALSVKLPASGTLMLSKVAPVPATVVTGPSPVAPVASEVRVTGTPP